MPSAPVPVTPDGETEAKATDAEPIVADPTDPIDATEAETPAAEAETPATEAETPAAETPAAETPATEAETTAAETPAAETPEPATIDAPTALESPAATPTDAEPTQSPQPEAPTLPTPPPPTPPPPILPVAGSPAHLPKRPGRFRGAIEWIVIIVAALIGALLMRTFLFQAFWIPSPSMVPTLARGDRVLVNKTSYKLHAVHRGDIVVFTHTPGFDPLYKDLIKRVIGLPGETVSAHGGNIYINGTELTEPYLRDATTTSDFAPTTIPPNSYWVMGDNRTNSQDSRVFGAIAKHQIVGRAFVLWWPLTRLHVF